MTDIIMSWGPTVLVAVIVIGAIRWIMSRYAKLFATQAENARAQTAATLQLAQTLERIAAALEKRTNANP